MRRKKLADTEKSYAPGKAHDSACLAPRVRGIGTFIESVHFEVRRQCIIVIPLNNKPDICQFWYTTALLRPVRVHQKVHKNSSPNWPKKAKIQRSLWSKELLQKLCYKTVLCLVGKIELKGTNLIGDVFSKDERRQNNSSKSIGRKLYSVLGIA